MASIEVSGLTKEYASGRHGDDPARSVLDALDLRIQDQEFVCILGPSGCGKSTFLNIVSGLDREYSGSVSITPGADEPAEPRIGYVFQEPRLLPWLTSAQNIVFALRNCRVGSPRDWPATVSRSLAMVGLQAQGDAYPHQLSGGMRQRLALARALSVSPSVLLMDEPFSGLDELTARRIRVDLLRIWRETRKTVVFVTHNAFEAAFLADRILVMARGRIRQDYRVMLPRPRDYDDPAVFEVNRAVVKTFLETAETA
jgi:NitT/TauT family transport system ATP-binding protein